MTFEEQSKPRRRWSLPRVGFVVAFLAGALVVGVIVLGFSRGHTDKNRLLGSGPEGGYPGIAQGTIRDHTGAPIKYVKIKITTIDNQKLVSMTTDEVGYYERTMAIGPYQLHAYLNGKEVIQNIIVTENGTQNGDILLSDN